MPGPLHNMLTLLYNRLRRGNTYINNAENVGNHQNCHFERLLGIYYTVAAAEVVVQLKPTVHSLQKQGAKIG